jgi:hypothetical protein
MKRNLSRAVKHLSTDQSPSQSKTALVEYAEYLAEKLPPRMRQRRRLKGRLSIPMPESRIDQLRALAQWRGTTLVELVHGFLDDEILQATIALGIDGLPQDTPAAHRRRVGKQFALANRAAWRHCLDPQAN